MPGNQQRGGLHCAGQRVPAEVLSVPGTATYVEAVRAHAVNDIEIGPRGLKGSRVAVDCG